MASLAWGNPVRRLDPERRELPQGGQLPPVSGDLL